MEILAYKSPTNASIGARSNIKEEEDEEKDLGRDAIIGAGATGAGLAVMPSAYRKALGLKKLYHGTVSPEAIKNIPKVGLNPEYGGTGASTILDEWVDNSKNNVHVSGSKLISMGYATPGAEGNPVDAAAGKVFDIDMPYTKFDRDFEHDNDFAFGADEKQKKTVKEHIAAKSNKGVDPKYIKGSDDRKFGDVTREALSGFKDYASKHPGRLAGGVATGLVGAGLIGYGGKKLHDTWKERKRRQEEDEEESGDMPKESMLVWTTYPENP